MIKCRIKPKPRYGPGWFPKQSTLRWRLYKRPDLGPWLLINLSHSGDALVQAEAYLSHRRLALYIAPFMLSIRSRTLTSFYQWFPSHGLKYPP